MIGKAREPGKASRGEESRRRTVGLYLALGVLCLLAVGALLGRPAPHWTWTRFRTAIAADQVERVEMGPHSVSGVRKLATGDKSDARFAVVRVEDPDLVKELVTHHVEVSGVVERDFSSWMWMVASLALLWWLMRGAGAMSGLRGGMLAPGQSRARIYAETSVGVTFDDVAGVDEAKDELREVIGFLASPDRFRAIGGRLPRGILLVGPPGTGKTLLARAVAGEARVPFFSISGSEFVELFVGVGAARVRDLFVQARAIAPCIVFIDELDAIGKVRGVGPLSHEEREQTLNQLLVEMDGFDPATGVVLMAATNRPEVLDPALLRAGRFDRHVLVDRPDRAGRVAILKVHARKVTLDQSADLDAIAGMTAGMVGADLATLLNEAALLAVRHGKRSVSTLELEEALERVVAGLEKKSRVLTASERARVAVHECGHALVALALPGSPAPRKISILPRGVAALGYTLQLPTEDRFLLTQSELEDRVAVLLAGRAAEEVALGEVSTGAQDDLIKATEAARHMVTSYGMSARVGKVSLDAPPTMLGMPSPGSEHGAEVARIIDEEVRRILDEQHARARHLLAGDPKLLGEAAALLLERESLSGDDLRALRDRRAHERVAS